MRCCTGFFKQEKPTQQPHPGFKRLLLRLDGDAGEKKGKQGGR
jgi:hypothetical protein